MVPEDQSSWAAASVGWWSGAARCAGHPRLLRHDPSGTWYPSDNPALLGEIGQWLAFADGITGTASAAPPRPVLRVRRRGSTGRRSSSLPHPGRAPGSGSRKPGLIARPDINHRRHCLLSLHNPVGGRRRTKAGLPAIRRWCDRVKRLKGFTVMSGVFPPAGQLPGAAGWSGC